MAMEWTAKLAVGVESIDMQHRELFARVNKLITAMQSQQGEAEVRRLVAFLGDYVVSHFAGEERLMQQHAYPDFPAHQRIHVEFMKDLARLKGELEKQGPSAAVIVQLNRRVGDWLIDHVGRTDRALGAFLTKKNARPAVQP
jgi:hemerythrin